MFRVRVDSSEITNITREGLSALSRGEAKMFEILQEKAAEERATHMYQNRTQNLELSTFAEYDERYPNGTAVEFAARMPYAEFVNRRGLMRIDELADEAEMDIDFMLDAEAERLGNL